MIIGSIPFHNATTLRWQEFFFRPKPSMEHREPLAGAIVQDWLNYRPKQVCRWLEVD
jgi:hypothetical protein